MKVKIINDPIISTLLNLILDDLESLLKVCEKRNLLDLDLIQEVQKELYNKTISTTYINFDPPSTVDKSGEERINNFKELLSEKDHQISELEKEIERLTLKSDNDGWISEGLQKAIDELKDRKSDYWIY